MKKLLFILILSCYFKSFAHFIPTTVCDLNHHCKQIVCDNYFGKEFCNDVDGPCPDDRPLKADFGLCISCEDTKWTGSVRSSEDCKVCPNRKVLEYRGHFYCISQKIPQNKPLVLKYGYQYCDYCVDEDDILDCSKCLEDYDIINGKCKMKQERACCQP